MKVNFEHCLINEKEFYAKEYQKKVPEIHSSLHSGGVYGTHWVDYPLNYDKKEFAKVQKLAREISKNSNVLLVVGIGGSYLGAKAGINMLPRKSNVEVIFTGINFDYADLGSTLERIKDKDITVNVISKSGSTVEALSTLNIVERFMKNKYKNEYKSRMIFTTSKDKGYLNSYATANGIETLSVPDGMGGRYSVLCSVGLLPFLCAGINIKKILEGALDAYHEFNTSEIEKNAAYKYAIYRHLLNKKLGKKMELFASFSYNFTSFGYWLQQLFTESEGKDGKGLFVCPVAYSTDLHSVGQFVQDGSPILAETFIDVKSPLKDNNFTNIPLDSPIKFLDGKTMREVNRAAYEGTVQAHIESNVPIVSIEVDDVSEYTFGYLVYFFELSCAMSGYLLGINPFNQPGVESYKAKMKALLKY